MNNVDVIKNKEDIEKIKRSLIIGDYRNYPVSYTHLTGRKKEDADLEQLEEKKVEVTSDIESAEKKEDADLEQLEENQIEVISDVEPAEKKESVDTAQSVEKTTVKTDIDVFDYNQDVYKRQE